MIIETSEEPCLDDTITRPSRTLIALRVNQMGYVGILFFFLYTLSEPFISEKHIYWVTVIPHYFAFGYDSSKSVA